MKRKEVKVEKKDRKMLENALLAMCEELKIEFHKKGHCYSSILFLSLFQHQKMSQLGAGDYITVTAHYTSSRDLHVINLLVSSRVCACV